MEELIKQFGLPLALSVFFIYQYLASNKEHKGDLKGIVQLTTTALDKNTDALDKNTEALIRVDEVVNRKGK